MYYKKSMLIVDKYIYVQIIKSYLAKYIQKLRIQLKFNIFTHCENQKCDETV